MEARVLWKGDWLQTWLIWIHKPSRLWWQSCVEQTMLQHIMMSPAILWLSCVSGLWKWLVALPFIFCEPPTIRGRQWPLIRCCSYDLLLSRNRFLCPPEEWWAARDLRKWVTTFFIQVINNQVMPARRHQIWSVAVANLWWNHWWAVMMSQVRSDITAITPHLAVWMPDGL